MSSWQLFLSDSIVIDKSLQSAVEYGVRLLMPQSKGHSPSRLSFFVSLSNRGSPETVDQDKKKNIAAQIAVLGGCDTILKFKSILFTVATVGLTLHPISYYYPPSKPTSTTSTSANATLQNNIQNNVQNNAQNNVQNNVHPGPGVSPLNIPLRPSSPLDISARKRAVSVLENMVTGLDLRKWFISPSSTSNTQLRSTTGSKVGKQYYEVISF